MFPDGRVLMDVGRLHPSGPGFVTSFIYDRTCLDKAKAMWHLVRPYTISLTTRDGDSWQCERLVYLEAGEYSVSVVELGGDGGR